MKKIVMVLLVVCPVVSAQNPRNGNLTVLGNFDVTQGSANFSKPMTTVTADPSGVCSNAAAMVVNTTAGANLGHISGCLNGSWALIGGGGGSGGFTNPMTTVGDLIMGGTVTAGTAAATRLAAGTSGYQLTSNGPGTAPTWQVAASGGVTGAQINGGAAINPVAGILNIQLPGISATGQGINSAASGSGNAQLDTLYAVNTPNVRPGTETTFTIPATTCSGSVTATEASAVAWNLPQSGLGSTNGITNFYAGCRMRLVNVGAGTLTVTITGSQLAGSNTLVIPGGTGANPTFADIVADGANYAMAENNLTAGAGGIPTQVNDTNGNAAIKTLPVTTGVDYLQVTPGPTGAGVTLTSTGTDTNVALYLATKGNEQIRVNAPFSLVPSAAYTCSTTAQGVFHYIHGNATTKDTVEVCAQDVSGTWAWRSIY